MTTQEKIIEALYTIKDVCNEHDRCEDCPFGEKINGVGKCVINRKLPEYWEITDGVEVWRAVK